MGVAPYEPVRGADGPSSEGFSTARNSGGNLAQQQPQSPYRPNAMRWASREKQAKHRSYGCPTAQRAVLALDSLFAFCR